MSAQHTDHPGRENAPLPWFLRAAALLYRRILSPLLHTTQRTLIGSAGACRFQPTCSEYATLAVHLHGPLQGGMLALRRILRCHPFAQGDFDPVPSANPRVRHSSRPHRDELGADAIFTEHPRLHPTQPSQSPGHLP